MYEEVEKRRKEQKEEDELEARIKLMKRMSKKRQMEEERLKPRKRARIEVDWRTLQTEMRQEREDRDDNEVDGELSEEQSEVDDAAEDNIDEALRIMESDEEESNPEPKEGEVDYERDDTRSGREEQTSVEPGVGVEN